jgi:hypothetical protein
MTEIILRQIKETDAPSIQEVALEAWRYPYHAIFDQEFIENFVRRNYAPEATLSLLPRIHSGNMFFHVAEQDSRIVGFCNIALSEQGAQLLRIYLLPSYKERPSSDEMPTHFGTVG